MAKVLTAAAVERYRPTGKRRVIRDAGARSLYLVVEASGHKSWLMRFRRPGGKAGKMVLGPVDLSGHEVTGDVEIGMPLTLVAARQLAARVHRDRARGTDVVAEHKSRRHRQRAASEERGANAFGALARRFIEEHAKVRTRRWHETARLLGLDPEDLEPIPGGLAERWGDKDARSIDGHDIYTVVDEARRIGTPGIKVNKNVSEPRARALYAALSSCLGWLQRHRRIDVNPCAGVWRPPPRPARDRVLTDDEVKKFWIATDMLAQPFGSVLRLLLLTGARLNEIARLRWEEVSEDQAALNIPGTRTKNHRAYIVPLAPTVREIAAAMPRIEGCPFVFSTNGQTPISGWSKVKAKLNTAMGASDWRLHDLRRTAVTGMAELGIAPHVIELAVNHVSGARAGVAGVYNRSEMMAERRAALERWAAHLAGIVAGKAPVAADLESERRRRRARS